MAATDVTKKEYLSWEQIYDDCSRLAGLLKALGPWEGIIAVTRGGMIPAAIIAHQLPSRNVGVMTVIGYDGEVQLEQTKVIQTSVYQNGGEGYVVIDDLSDTGRTADEIRRVIPSAAFACLYVKPLGKPKTQEWVREYSQDTWIVFPWEV